MKSQVELERRLQEIESIVSYPVPSANIPLEKLDPKLTLIGEYQSRLKQLQKIRQENRDIDLFLNQCKPP
jgi:hypothetical protein